jgi:hypothetical protein
VPGRAGSRTPQAPRSGVRGSRFCRASTINGARKRAPCARQNWGYRTSFEPVRPGTYNGKSEETDPGKHGAGSPDAHGGFDARDGHSPLRTATPLPCGGHPDSRNGGEGAKGRPGPARAQEVDKRSGVDVLAVRGLGAPCQSRRGEVMKAREHPGRAPRDHILASSAARAQTNRAVGTASSHSAAAMTKSKRKGLKPESG